MADDRTGNHYRTSSLKIDLQAFDPDILQATRARGLCSQLGQSLETSQRLLSMRFLECDHIFPHVKTQQSHLAKII